MVKMSHRQCTDGNGVGSTGASETPPVAWLIKVCGGVLLDYVGTTCLMILIFDDTHA